jgi:hypothetical protein
LEPLDRFGAKVCSTQNLTMGEELSYPTASFLQPLLLRSGEAQLAAPPTDWLWQQAIHRLTQYPLGPALVDMLGGWQRETELDQSMVQKGYTPLQGEGHRVTILVAQKRRQARYEYVLIQPLG